MVGKAWWKTLEVVFQLRFLSQWLNTMNKSNLGRIKGYCLHMYITVHPWSHSRQEIKQGEDIKVRSFSDTWKRLLFMAFSASLYQGWNPTIGQGHSHGLGTQSIIKKMRTDLPIAVSCGGIYSFVVLSSQLTMACLNLV